jgi:hypothetical protein
MTITQSSTRLVALVAGVAVAISLLAGALVAAAPAQAAALTQSQISSIISLLQSFGADAATISNVQASLNGQPTSGTGGSTSTGGSCSVSWTRDLQAGSSGSDVKMLQQILNMWPETMISASGAGSPGNETMTFGPATKAAVIKFQMKYGITPAAGYAGAKTRAQLMTLCAGSTGNTGGNTGGNTNNGTSLMVSAAAQPTNALAPNSASRIPFTKFTVTAPSNGDVVLNSVTVQRQGLAQDAAFSGVELLGPTGIQLGISKTLNSNHQATIGSSVTIPRGTSMTFTVAANRACTGSSSSGCTTTSYAGQIASFGVVALNTSAAVSGSLPIVGASHTINETVSIGTAQAFTSSFDPITTITKSIGDTGVKFAGIRVTAGSAEADRLWSVTWNQSGSAGSSDLANLMVYVDGTPYPVTVSADGKYYTATFGSGIFIDKGLSKDIYVQGDVVGSSVSGRTVELDIYKGTDIYLTGETYGYGVTVTPGGGTCITTPATGNHNSGFVNSSAACSGTAGNPFFQGAVVQVNPGSASSITRASSVGATNIAVNVPNQVLGGFTTNFVGEPVSVQSLVFHFNWSSGAASSNLLTNVSLVDENGAVVSGPVDGSDTGGTSQKVTFNDTVTFPTGMHTYSLKGKVPSTVANNVTIQASTTPSSDWSNITGQTSGNSIALTGNGLFSMSTMTVKGAKLSINLSTTPASSNIVSGGIVEFADVQLDATQSGENVRISSILLTPSAATGLSSCQLWNGSTAVNTGSNVPTTYTAATSKTFTFDNSLEVPKGSQVTLALKCYVSSAASGGYHWDIVSGDWTSVTATGKDSGNTLTPANGGLTVTSATGGTMTVGSAGTLAVALAPDVKSYSLAANGTSAAELGKLRFTATNEDINLTKVGLILSNSSASSTPSDVTSLTLWDGATQVGTVTFSGTNRTATSSTISGVTIPNGGYKDITIKGNLATLTTNAGVGNNAKPGALVQVNYNAADTTGTQGTGVSSNSTINAPTTSASNTAVAGVRVFKSWPIISTAPTSGNLQNGTWPLITVTVQANQTGDVTLYKLSFAVATTSASLTAPTFSGPNGSVGTVAFNAAGTELTATFDSASNTGDKYIASNASKTFTIGATVAGITASTAAVASFSLEADTAYPSLATLMDQAANISGGKTIWSPNSTTTPAAITTNDWTNGYGLPGCFATSGLGQNCYASSKAQ